MLREAPCEEISPHRLENVGTVEQTPQASVQSPADAATKMPGIMIDELSRGGLIAIPRALDQGGKIVGWECQTYDATGLPEGLGIDPDLGWISGIVLDSAVNSDPYNVTVMVDDGVGETTSVTFQWLVNANAINGVSVTPTLTATAGIDTGDLTLGTFTTPDFNSAPSDFEALITWGDGTTSEGTVTDGAEGFMVTGRHIYEQTGSLSVGLTIADIMTGASATAATTGTANVADAPWTVTGDFQEGTLVGQGGTFVVALVADSAVNITSGNFTVLVDPGDGSGAVSGTLTELEAGEWAVSFTHTYSQVGAFTATVTVTDVHGTQRAYTSVVEVGALEVGVPATLTVAQFYINDSLTPVLGYSATIWWGDGTSSSGTVSGSAGVFTVSGSHTYTTDSIDELGGAYAVKAQLTNSSDVLMTANRSVIVTRPPIALQVANVIEADDGTVGSQTVATFEVPNNTDDASEFSATIDWGDGTTSAATVAGSNGLFQVVGDHTYASLGDHSIQVTVSQGWSSFGVAVLGTALVSGAAPPARPLPVATLAEAQAWSNSGFPQAKGVTDLGMRCPTSGSILVVRRLGEGSTQSFLHIRSWRRSNWVTSR